MSLHKSQEWKQLSAFWRSSSRVELPWILPAIYLARCLWSWAAWGGCVGWCSQFQPDIHWYSGLAAIFFFLFKSKCFQSCEHPEGRRAAPALITNPQYGAGNKSNRSRPVERDITRWFEFTSKRDWTWKAHSEASLLFSFPLVSLQRSLYNQTSPNRCT